MEVRRIKIRKRREFWDFSGRYRWLVSRDRGLGGKARLNAIVRLVLLLASSYWLLAGWRNKVTREREAKI